MWTARSLNAAEASGVEALGQDAAAAMLPADLLHDDEVILLLLRPSPLFVPLSCMTSLIFIAFVAVLLAYAAPFVSRWQNWIAWSDVQAFGLGIGFAMLRLGWQALEWYSRVYVLTDRRILRRMGVLRVSVFQAELRNIQHTTVFARVRERVFGLGSIGFATSGSDVLEAYWVMIRDPFGVQKIVVEAIRRYGKHSKR